MKCHDKAVDTAAKILENQGCICSRNERLDSRIPDLKCCDAYIEVKATSSDLHSTRTEHQLHDIKKAANIMHKPAILYNDVEHTFVPLNNKGKSFISEYELDHSTEAESEDVIASLGAIAGGVVLFDLIFNQGRGTQQVINGVNDFIVRAVDSWNSSLQPRY